ncbi:hypothetical protein FN846DRAFT_911898 [Sphaerosporella brunnea]|uniref:C2H2-type domain-containing protein n=1 Tax=Sphaerosporella brunnea TaxID=1250544 RepID=A0A5J5EHZ8_9PEZI|nr:hypothetical protein FN846DRAFT_911898 [Sphaerosporella brunnea]
MSAGGMANKSNSPINADHEVSEDCIVASPTAFSPDDHSSPDHEVSEDCIVASPTAFSPDDHSSPDPPVYECVYNGCEKVYGTLGALNKHVTNQQHGALRTRQAFPERPQRQTLREIKRPYVCGYNGCTYAYVKHHTLNLHRAQTGHGPRRSLKKRRPSEIDRIYVCGWNNECKNAYPTITSLNAHVTRKGHGPRRTQREVERPFKCVYNGCDKAYAQLWNLNVHVTNQRHGALRTRQDFPEAANLFEREKRQAAASELKKRRAAAVSERKKRQAAVPELKKRPAAKVA